jgi:sorbitol/mannitol transport system permease protein
MTTIARPRPRAAGHARGRQVKRWSARLAWTVLVWVAAIAFFLPVLWMVLTAFKPETAAYSYPPKFTFSPTLSEFRTVFSRGIGPYLENSVFATLVSTVLVLLLALPASYALSISPVGKWRDSLFFFISTKMLPIVAAIVPIYIVARDVHLLDNVYALVLLYAGMNLPIAVWMLRSFMLEVPGEVLEAARIDGAGLFREITRVIMPIIMPGIAASALICIIFAWNEFFFAVNLTSTVAATMPVFLVGFITSEGLFWAQLSAAATVASVPIIIIGWIAQKQLVRGLSMGALK